MINQSEINIPIYLVPLEQDFQWKEKLKKDFRRNMIVFKLSMKHKVKLLLIFFTPMWLYSLLKKIKNLIDTIKFSSYKKKGAYGA